MQLDPDGRRLLFVRSPGGTDPVGSPVVAGRRRGHRDAGRRPARAADRAATRSCPPRSGPAASAARESGGGIVGYATDRDATVAAFALSSRLWVADLTGPAPARPRAAGRRQRDRPAPGPDRHAGSPTPADGARCTSCAATAARRATLGSPEAAEVTWGLAEFVAAEEMGRYRGYWWSPDGADAAGRAGRREPGAAVAHRRPGTPRDRRRPRSPTRRRARANADGDACACSGSTAAARDVAVGPVALPLPRARATGRSAGAPLHPGA